MHWLGYALLSAFFAGLAAIFGKIGVRDVDATLATTARAIIMATALVVLMFLHFLPSSLIRRQWHRPR